MQLRRIKKSDVGELTPYNIVPLEAPAYTNAIGMFPEASPTLLFTIFFSNQQSVNYSTEGLRTIHKRIIKDLENQRDEELVTLIRVNL